MMDLLRLRFAAGVCVLVAGLLMGAGGEVAVADPGSSGSAAQGDEGTNASGQQHSTGVKKPKDKPVGTDSEVGSLGSGVESRPKDKPSGVDNKVGSVGSGGESGQQPAPDAKEPKDKPVGTDASAATNDDADLGAAASPPVATVPTPVATVPTPAATAPNEVAPVSDVVTPVSDVVGPVAEVGAPVQNVLTPIVGAGVQPTQLQFDLYSFLLGIAGTAPVSDVIALVQNVLSSVAGAVVLLAQLPADLFSFLMGIAGVQPVVDGVRGTDSRGLSTAAGASVASRLAPVLPFAGISGTPLAGVSGVPSAGSEPTEAATLDVMALGRASAVSEKAPPAPDGASPTNVQSSFRHVFSGLLLPVSLWALALGALPGAGGLGLITLAGVRVGYRQAKAGVALRTTAIAHLARPGPLGVVGPVALSVFRPRALSAEHLLDKAA